MVSYKPLQYTVPLLHPSKKGETSRDGGQDGGAAKSTWWSFPTSEMG